MRPENRTVERVLARLATRRHGLVTRAQLVSAGITPAEIAHRVRCGALLRVHRGVYRVGHLAPSVEARYMAAVLACGEGARLRGRAAGHLLGLLRGDAPPPEVATPTERRVAGIQTRRARRLHPDDATTWNAIPVTAVARTLVDLAADVSVDALARACHEADVRHAITAPDVDRVLGRLRTAPGAGRLRAVLHGDTGITLSKLERCFLARLRDAGLALPATNRRIDGRVVDCRWPDLALTIELDGYRFHRSRHAWEQDRRREREARARGDDFRRFTYGDVLEHPGPMLAELRAILPPSRPAVVT